MNKINKWGKNVSLTVEVSEDGVDCEVEISEEHVLGFVDGVVGKRPDVSERVVSSRLQWRQCRRHVVVVDVDASHTHAVVETIFNFACMKS